MKKLTYLLIILFASTQLWAHPVIYKGGFVYEGQFNSDMNTQRFGYTLDPKYSIELNSSWYSNIDDYRDYTLGFNYLFKRWLNQDSQGNLYGALHTGRYSDMNSSGNVNHYMLMGDWESREIYTAGSIMHYQYGDNTMTRYSYRIGFAPYVAGMNTLQNWMIFKFDYLYEDLRHVTITPMMRFFYRNVLWEFGSTLEGNSFLTLMIHY